MTEIEDLVREALAATPTASPTTDPVGALDRRVRRARKRVAAGAGAVAAVVVAAIVVPLAVVGGGNGSPNSIKPVTPPPTSPLPNGTTLLSSTGAVWVSAADGKQWLLEQHPARPNDFYVAQVGPDGPDKGFVVSAPADYVVAGDNVVWVIGGGDGGSSMSRLTAIDTRTGHVATKTFESVLLSFASTAGDSLYVVQSGSNGAAVDRVDVVGGALSVVATKSFVQPEELVTTSNDHVWVHTDKQFVELLPDPNGFHVGATARWDGRLDGPAGLSVWTYADQRLDCLDAEHEDAAPSLSQGCRLAMGGDVGQAVGTPDTGVFVSIVDGLTNASDVGIAWFDRSDVQGKDSGPWGPTAYLSGVQVISMARDQTGGVDYVDDQGRLIRWDPTAVQSR